MTDLRRLLRNEYVKTAVSISLVAAVILAFFFGLGLALGNSVPLRVVESGSMCTMQGGCDGFSHPFDQTLHVGDIIVIQSVDPAELNADYPNSDIIVYQKPVGGANSEATPIVHRIVAKYQDEEGTWFFQTKGDGNGDTWPSPPDVSQYDSHTLWTTGQGVSEDLVLGKVVMRIPYFGWVTLIMKSNSWMLPLIVVLIMLLIIVEFAAPVLRRKKAVAEQQNPGVKQP
ncbi:MAG: S26 family signal peptidase [Candidatus Bathyarchaeota archaeon]|nr:S26 family signal peptidase [Candidatus Bathyarchaeota archaeon]